MKVFLSWSGETSRAIAEALRDWLPKVIQAVVPWMSAVDIEKGARWSSDIAAELEQTSFGILCLTADNRDAPWIHFEAGALSKTLQNTLVCPYLFDLEPTDLTGPLVQFNATRANKKDTQRLVLSINDAQETPLTQLNIEESFEVWWPKLEECLRDLAVAPLQAKPKRPEREILEEILDLVREQSKANIAGGDLPEVFDFDDSLISSSPDVRGFLPGSYVQHSKFGRGLVLKQEGKGDSVVLTISFPGFGQKRLVQKHAGLSKA